MKPLLSIIIPTKNRQYTAIHAVASALNIVSDQIEVVVQDCSDDNKLHDLLKASFKDDRRIKYFYSNNKPSLTENWNLAISNTNGKYLIGIGDDDAVLSSCLDVVNWMNEHNIDTTLSMHITYIWKDAYVGSISNSRLSFSNNISGEIFKVDLPTEINKKALNCGFGYTEDLPNLYHGIVRKSLLDTHKERCGYYLSSSSFDVYNAIMLSAYTDSFYYIDYPLTIRGVSGKSNANRIIKKQSHLHLQEFKELYVPENLPKIFNSEVSIAESAIVALQDIGRGDLVERMNIAIVFGKTAADNLSKSLMFFDQYRKAKKHDKLTNRMFFTYFFSFLKDKYKASFRNVLLKAIFKIVPSADDALGKLTARTRVKAKDISEATEIIENHVRTNHLYIKFNEQIKKLASKKYRWEK